MGISYARAVKQGAALVAKLCKREARYAEKSGVVAGRKMTKVCSKNKQPAFLLIPPALPKPWDFNNVVC